MFSGDYSSLVYSYTLDLSILGGTGGGVNKHTSCKFIVHASYYMINTTDDPYIP
jgi:hypothetical protein